MADLREAEAQRKELRRRRAQREGGHDNDDDRSEAEKTPSRHHFSDPSFTRVRADAAERGTWRAGTAAHGGAIRPLLTPNTHRQRLRRDRNYSGRSSDSDSSAFSGNDNGSEGEEDAFGKSRGRSAPPPPRPASGAVGWALRQNPNDMSTHNNTATNHSLLLLRRDRDGGSHPSLRRQRGASAPIAATKKGRSSNAPPRPHWMAPTESSRGKRMPAYIPLYGSRTRSVGAGEEVSSDDDTVDDKVRHRQGTARSGSGGKGRGGGESAETRYQRVLGSFGRRVPPAPYTNRNATTTSRSSAKSPSLSPAAAAKERAAAIEAETRMYELRRHYRRRAAVELELYKAKGRRAMEEREARRAAAAAVTAPPPSRRGERERAQGGGRGENNSRSQQHQQPQSRSHSDYYGRSASEGPHDDARERDLLRPRYPQTGGTSNGHGGPSLSSSFTASTSSRDGPQQQRDDQHRHHHRGEQGGAPRANSSANANASGSGSTYFSQFREQQQQRDAAAEREAMRRGGGGGAAANNNRSGSSLNRSVSVGDRPPLPQIVHDTRHVESYISEHSAARDRSGHSASSPRTPQTTSASASSPLLASGAGRNAYANPFLPDGFSLRPDEGRRRGEVAAAVTASSAPSLAERGRVADDKSARGADGRVGQQQRSAPASTSPLLTPAERALLARYEQAVKTRRYNK